MIALLQAVVDGTRNGPPDNAAFFRAAYVVAALVYGGYGVHLVRRVARIRARSTRTPRG
jgi:hypothetical protein